MTIDPLDQTEDWARLAFARQDLTQPELEDILALVDIARAARDPDLFADGDWQAQKRSVERLEAALARLDNHATPDPR